MIAKCRDITNKINELENRLNNFSEPKLQNEMKKERTVDFTKDLSRPQMNKKYEAEKEIDAMEKPVREFTRKSPFDDKITNVEDVTVMGMINNHPSKWPFMSCSGNGPPKLVSRLSDDEKTMDNFFIDSLRDEIEKLRQRLSAVGNRSSEYSRTESCQLEENNILEDGPNGDRDYQPELLKMMKELQTKNCELTDQLETYKKNQENSMVKSEETAKMLKTYGNKMNSLYEQTLKSSKMMAHSKEKFCKILKSRNEQIKNLFDTNQQLKKNLVMNEEQMHKLKNNYKLFKSNYKEMEKNYQQNREENEKYRESIAALKAEMKIVHKECKTLKEENENIFKKLNDTKGEIIRKFASKFDGQERQYQDLLLAVHSGAKLQEDEFEMLQTDTEYDTIELQIKYKKLVFDYEALVRKFREYEQFDEIKCSCIEQELKEFSMKMKEKECIILRERDDLRALVEELAQAINKNKISIHELISTNAQQENIIKSLNESIVVKDEVLLKYQEELKQVIIRYENSRREIDTLMETVAIIEEKSSPEKEEMEKSLQNSRAMLKQEKDNTLIKQKIIEDQKGTISDLKKQLIDKTVEIEVGVSGLDKMRNEVDRLSDELKYAEFLLEKEKTEKNRIQNELQNIKSYKETLITQISSLERAIKSRCRDDEINQIDQREKIDQLQKEMLQQREGWEVQRRGLQKDKEKALHAAKFASQKLLDTVNDFQKQMYQQKAAQTKLAMLLQAKEQQLENLTAKVRSLLPSQKECDNNVSFEKSPRFQDTYNS